MWNPTSRTTFILIGFFALALSATVRAVPISLFGDTDTFIKHAKDIVIVEVTGGPERDPDSYVDGFYPVEINILMPLKGDKAKGKTTLATIYRVEKGTRYMISSLGGSAYGTDLLALPELSVVPLPARMELKNLEGKPLKEQMSLVFQRRLFELKFTQKELTKERSLLEKAVEAPRSLWAGLSVQEPVITVDQVGNQQINFALVNDTSQSLDLNVDLWRLVVNGRGYLGDEINLANGPRNQHRDSLPAGGSLRFSCGLGDLFKSDYGREFFKTPGTYTISWFGAGFESDPIIFRVIEVPAKAAVPAASGPATTASAR